MKKFLALVGLGIAFVGVWFASAMVQSHYNDDVVNAEAAEAKEAKEAVAKVERFEYAYLTTGMSRKNSLDTVFNGMPARDKTELSPIIFTCTSLGNGHYGEALALLKRANELGKEGWEIAEQGIPSHGLILLKRDLKD